MELVSRSVSHFYRTEIILPSVTNNILKRHDSTLYEHIRKLLTFKLIGMYFLLFFIR
jgi:hypothetical protein